VNGEKSQGEAVIDSGQVDKEQAQADNKIKFAFKAKAPAATSTADLSAKMRDPPASVKSNILESATKSSSANRRNDSRTDYKYSRDGRRGEDYRPEKKPVKRLRPIPILPKELADSDSVYFRKPGNESVVGSGTYGKVFRAIHVYTGDKVALKKIRMEGERDGVSVVSFGNVLY